MKKIFLLASLLTMTSYIYGQSQKHKLKLSIKLLGYGTTSRYCSNKKLDTAYCIAITIKNQGDTAVAFGHMSCSWYDQFFFATNGYNACIFGCDKNIYSYTRLEPNQECTNSLFIYKTKNSTK